MSKKSIFSLDIGYGETDNKERMSKSTLIKLLMPLMAILVLQSGVNAQDPMGTACEPYGSVAIEGQPAANNLLVVAYVGDVELARTHTFNGQYSLVIPLDDPATPQRDGYRAGEIISIMINGSPATPSFEAFMGRQRRDIAVATLSIKIETWGRIKALFR
jgi:hypothetical protein